MIDATPNQLLKKLRQGYKIKVHSNEPNTDYCNNYWSTELYSYNRNINKYHVDYIEADLHIDREKDETLSFLDTILYEERIEECTIEILNDFNIKQKQEEPCICKDEIEEIEIKTKDGWFSMDDIPKYCPYCGRKLSTIDNDNIDIGETLEYHANL